MADFNPKEIKELQLHFRSLDENHDGSLSINELKQALERTGLKPTEQGLKQLLTSFDLNKSGEVDFDEYLHIVRELREGKTTSSLAASVVPRKSVKNVTESGSATHTYTEDEKEAFVEHINICLGHDNDLKSILPMNQKNDALFRSVHDGVLLCKLVNFAVPSTIDERVINKKPKNQWEISENHVLALKSCTGIGCSVVNIGSQDMLAGTPHLVLGLIWQIIRIGLLSQVSVTHHPELQGLLREGEDLADFLKLGPEQILLRWFNYHLEKAGSDRRVQNFSGDIKDSECYTILLHQVSGHKCDLTPLQERDSKNRAERMLEQADKIGCRKFVTSRDVVHGNPKLNLAFVANLFNHYPALEPVQVVAIEETREERAFRLWINSLGLNCNNLISDCRDGLLLIQLFDKIFPGIVNWKRVNDKMPLSKFKKVENCNYAVELGKEVKFSMVNIGGTDIVDGNQKLILGIVWQLMRANVINMLKQLSKGGKEVSDQDIINWANAKVSSSGRPSSIRSFQDPALRSSVFLIDLCYAVSNRAVNYDLVTPGESGEDAELNAKYVISVARKMGATIFLLWEDIVEIKPKMIMTLIAGLMVLDTESNQ